MRAILRSIINNPLPMIIMIFLTVVVGIYCLFHMPVDLFPRLEVPVVNIVTHYPAAGPEDVELFISRPIEDEMRSITGVKRVSSISMQGTSQVTVEFNWGTTIKEAREVVQARLAQVVGVLPAGVTPRLENIGTTLQEIVGFVVYGGTDPVTLRNIVQYDVASRLMEVEGVSSIQVIGGDQRAFVVSIKPEALAGSDLTIGDIVAALKEHNFTMAGGYLERSSREYLIHGEALLKTIDDIRLLPVMNRNKTPIPLGAIAKVTDAKVPKHYAVHGDGVPSVAFVVLKQPGENTIRIVQDVEKAMKGIHGLLPPSTQVKKYYDQSEIIAEARDEIQYDLLIGTFLVVFVLYFFLGSLRPTFIIASTIPISILVALIMMSLLGFSLNVITMIALAISIGMVVDDAIIVTENIYRHSLSSKSAKDASIEGAIEIAGPDASGTFTIVAAFLPLILTTGLAAVFLRPFGFTLSIALIVSLVLSLSVVPMLFGMGAHSLSRTDFLGARIMRWLDKTLQATLMFCFRHKALTLILAVSFFCMAGLGAFLGKANILPPIDEGAILIEYVMPPGTSLTESNRIGDILDRVALSDPDVSCVYRRTGTPETAYQIEGVNKGEVMIKLKAKDERKRSLQAIMENLKGKYSKINGVVFLYHQPTQEKIDESFSGLPALFGITIYGPDLQTLVSLGNKIEDIVMKDHAVANVVNNTKIKASQINVMINSIKLAAYDVPVDEVMSALQTVRMGIEATRIIRQKEEIAVLVKMDTQNVLDPMSIGNLPIMNSDGEIIPLGRVADIEVSQVPDSITRLNGQRELTLLAEVDGSIPSLISRLNKEFRQIHLPSGYSIEFTGQYKVLIKTAIEMLFVLISAIALIYLIMLVQFRSWLQPLIILLNIPFSLVGAVIALFIGGQGIDVSAGMGIITLVGISVNKDIVLIDYFNRRMAEGDTVQNALLCASSVRLRPILLTTLTTIIVLIPASLGAGVGSKIFQSFSLTIIGGLIAGMFATLIIVPTLIAIFPHHSPAKLRHIDS